MKTKRSIFIIVLFVMVANLGLYAQEINKKAMAGINKQVKGMVDVMELNKDQESKVLVIKKNQYIERQMILKQIGKNSPEFNDKVKKLNKASWGEIKAICTKEQIKKWYNRAKKQN
ncbi:hypothetical protein D1614_02470 [Maribellus luteus]|uniref:Uncharacterized protein n=1 Tax=Maribellus luteus TaxID=2305463 RepID=A0A399T9B7_9BACT|nr:hypothetical protein [Maribellus luteus]RIJ50807.1 hypothetical protein D1614_02470 [Maribellus luteus]